MQKATLRNAVLLSLAALGASFGAPQIARERLSVATASFGPAAAIDSALSRVESNVRASHLGFDTNVYPGDRAMAAWKASGDYEWVGYYLQASCHKDSSWSGTRSRLTANGWGLAVIYVGQQTWGQHFNASGAVKPRLKAARLRKGKHSRKKRSVGTMSRKSTKPVASAGATCSASLVNTNQGMVDARDAIARAEQEGFARGTIIFLDIEFMESLPQPMRDYYRAWTRAILADGRCRPGIYTHTRNAATVYDDVSDEYARAGIDGDPPFWVAGAGGFSPGRLPTDVGHTFASAWQGLLDVVRTVNGVRLPIDISVASVNSPSRAVQ